MAISPSLDTDLVGAVLRSLLALPGVFRLYPESHPSVGAAVHEVGQSLRDLLGENGGTIRFDVDHEDATVNGIVVAAPALLGERLRTLLCDRAICALELRARADRAGLRALGDLLAASTDALLREGVSWTDDDAGAVRIEWRELKGGTGAETEWPAPAEEEEAAPAGVVEIPYETADTPDPGWSEMCTQALRNRMGRDEVVAASFRVVCDLHLRGASKDVLGEFVAGHGFDIVEFLDGVESDVSPDEFLSLVTDTLPFSCHDALAAQAARFAGRPEAIQSLLDGFPDSADAFVFLAALCDVHGAAAAPEAMTRLLEDQPELWEHVAQTRPDLCFRPAVLRLVLKTAAARAQLAACRILPCRGPLRTAFLDGLAAVGDAAAFGVLRAGARVLRIASDHELLRSIAHFRCPEAAAWLASLVQARLPIYDLIETLRALHACESGSRDGRLATLARSGEPVVAAWARRILKEASA